VSLRLACALGVVSDWPVVLSTLLLRWCPTLLGSVLIIYNCRAGPGGLGCASRVLAGVLWTYIDICITSVIFRHHC